jgi:hypothetical protein
LHERIRKSLAALGKQDQAKKALENKNKPRNQRKGNEMTPTNALQHWKQ